MLLIDKCPICGSTLSIENVQKLLRGGDHMAAVQVKAGVCKKCGEIVFDAQTHNRFEEIRRQLKEEKVESLRPIGQAFAAGGSRNFSKSQSHEQTHLFLCFIFFFSFSRLRSTSTKSKSLSFTFTRTTRTRTLSPSR